MAIELDKFEPEVRSRARNWRRIAFGIRGSWDMADGALQVTLIRLYRHWPRIQRDSVAAYARKAIMRVTFDELKRSDRRHETPMSDVQLLGLEASAPTDLEAHSSSLREALLALPNAQRNVVALRYFGECSVDEVAALMRITPATVKSQASRAMATLRQTLTPRP